MLPPPSFFQTGSQVTQGFSLPSAVSTSSFHFLLLSLVTGVPLDVIALIFEHITAAIRAG